MKADGMNESWKANELWGLSGRTLLSSRPRANYRARTPAPSRAPPQGRSTVPPRPPAALRVGPSLPSQRTLGPRAPGPRGLAETTEHPVSGPSRRSGTSLLRLRQPRAAKWTGLGSLAFSLRSRAEAPLTPWAAQPGVGPPPLEDAGKERASLCRLVEKYRKEAIT